LFASQEFVKRSTVTVPPSKLRSIALRAMGAQSLEAVIFDKCAEMRQRPLAFRQLLYHIGSACCCLTVPLYRQCNRSLATIDSLAVKGVKFIRSADYSMGKCTSCNRDIPAAIGSSFRANSLHPRKHCPQSSNKPSCPKFIDGSPSGRVTSTIRQRFSNEGGL